jgi:predicted dehydrogenase
MTYLSLGIVGHGSVALAHAAALATIVGVRISAIVGRDLARAQRFADPLGATAFGDLDAFAQAVDVAIVASPSGEHRDQAIRLLEVGVTVLVELPTAPDLKSLDRMIEASTASAGLFATHTARFLPATSLVSRVLRDRTLGDLESVAIDRRVRSRSRSWQDDPLVHHGQHAIDLVSLWFGGLAVETATIDGRRACLSGQTPAGVPVSIAIEHEADEDAMRIELVGSEGRLTTDGFGAASATVPLEWNDLDPTDAYLRAIATQDAAFLAALRGTGSYPDIGVTRANLAIVDQARGLAAR